ncbi:MAG: hypothetical protein UT00_C0015G0002 [Parcubacteria group bacterium GW2011_GWA1_38_7]|nr:MAG: hypothetical protein UT00_C0015G0002 [Parcubacteria group bacterium GW2011_GWA1_38_7]
MENGNDGHQLSINGKSLDRKNKQREADKAAIKHLTRAIVDPDEFQLELAEVIIIDQLRANLARKKTN